MGTQLLGQTAIITGASSGIGRAIAELFGQEGAHVFLIGRTREPMEESKTKIEQAGGRATIAVFDLRDIARLQQFIIEVQAQTGRLDILVNNAGVFMSDSLLEAEPEDWRAMLEINVLAVLAGSQAAVRAMRRTGGEGRILTISSLAAQRPESGVYGATKHAVNVIMATLRKELERESIRVTTLMPGAVATNFARYYEPAALKALLGVSELPFPHQQGQRMPDSVLEQIQLNLNELLCSPADIARAALFAVTQPINVNIADLTVRPARSVGVPAN
jgi:NADP-dependent 3-hydroxy acid dehydrogenase YdfG